MDVLGGDGCSGDGDLWPAALTKDEEALRRRAGRLLESLRRIPSIYADPKAWENEHEVVFSLFRRGCLDGSNTGILEAPIYNNRQIEDAWIFLVEMRIKHPNRKKNVEECSSILGRSDNWSMVLHGSRKLRAVLLDAPVGIRQEILEAAGAADLFSPVHRLDAQDVEPSHLGDRGPNPSAQSLTLSEPRSQHTSNPFGPPELPIAGRASEEVASGLDEIQQRRSSVSSPGAQLLMAAFSPLARPAHLHELPTAAPASSHLQTTKPLNPFASLENEDARAPPHGFSPKASDFGQRRPLASTRPAPLATTSTAVMPQPSQVLSPAGFGCVAPPIARGSMGQNRSRLGGNAGDPVGHHSAASAQPTWPSSYWPPAEGQAPIGQVSGACSNVSAWPSGNAWPSGRRTSVSSTATLVGWQGGGGR